MPNNNYTEPSDSSPADRADEFPARRETNVEFLTRLMEESRSGPIAQLVIITAIEHYLDAVLADVEAFKKDMAGNPIISPEGWVRACTELKAEFTIRHERLGRRG